MLVYMEIHPRGAVILGCEVVRKLALPFTAEELRNLERAYFRRVEFIYSKGFELIIDAVGYDIGKIRKEILLKIDRKMDKQCGDKFNLEVFTP